MYTFFAQITIQELPKEKDNIEDNEDGTKNNEGNLSENENSTDV